MQVPSNWKLIPICSSCAAAIPPDVIQEIDAVLDRAETKGGQQMTTIIADVGKALTGECTAPSFFSEAGQRAQQITLSGLHWRAMFAQKHRFEQSIERLKEIQPGSALPGFKTSIPKKKSDTDRWVADQLRAANIAIRKCRFCSRRLRP